MPFWPERRDTDQLVFSDDAATSSVAAPSP